MLTINPISKQEIGFCDLVGIYVIALNTICGDEGTERKGKL